MVGLPDGEKNFEDRCNRLGTIPACDRQTDRQTDRRTDRHLSTAYTRYAYASRSKNRDFRPISRCISEMIQDRVIVTMERQ